ncbi:peptidoglycan D,D-transpeptidase FtsI family protein [Cohnella faecalis]|uniref:Penicillin-binding protein 2 n=1 Tax=Cohnella faecalis TaxID=2315694 RepID=A0A398CND6_9BACL|nr:penicillin-binding transpeptidase domain-containing protein [Cohnella faecalis]RIE02759.1 penicillin-binding protein 2 [Cohnella faecalis]
MGNNKTEEAQKREIRNRRHFSFRLNVFFFATFFVFSLLIVRLAFLQFVEGPKLKEREHDIGTRVVPIPPIRGNIYDSTGTAIAYSTSTQSLYYTLEPGTKEADGKALAVRLFEVFAKYGNKAKNPPNAQEVFEDMDFGGAVHLPFQPRRIKSGLTKEEIAYFAEHQKEFKGVDILEESIRQYSDDQIAVQLVGYMKQMKGATSLDKYKDINTDQKDATLKYLESEEVGFDGIELMYQDELRGRNGLKTYPVNKDSRIVGPMQLTKPVKGENLFLTINKNIQLAAQKAITDQLNKLKHAPKGTTEYEGRNATTGYAVAMEVDTGKVVAMASMPDYNSNLWQGGISSKDYNSIKYFIGNGAIREVQPPYDDDKERAKHPSSLVFLGSTQKPLTILVGLSEKLITPSSSWVDPGYFGFGRKGHETKVRNAKSTPNGRLVPTTAIAKSSNAFMAAMVGNALYLRSPSKAVEIWDGYMKQFGLGVKTGSGLPGEQAGNLNYFKEEKNGSAQSAMIYSSFGQQAQYTVLQLAQYATVLASRGERLKPQFVDHIEDSDGNLVQPFQKELLNTVTFPKQYWQTIEAGMSQVKVQGFEDFPYSFNRKTGTSQQDVAGGKKVENSVFIAYAPADKPKLAVAVVVPEGGYGGWGAAPIARKIFDAYDEQVGLTGTPRKPTPASTVPADEAASQQQGDGANGAAAEQ